MAIQDGVAALLHAVLRDQKLRRFPAHCLLPQSMALDLMIRDGGHHFCNWKSRMLKAGWRREKGVCQLSFKGSFRRLPWTYHWLELGPMATSSCKECWEMYLLWIDIYLAKSRNSRRKGKPYRGGKSTSCHTTQEHTHLHPGSTYCKLLWCS